ncbi:MAG: hypothetical protein Q7R92_00375 [bacterium]|nr:hypothetical protein [bacterium]
MEQTIFGLPGEVFWLWFSAFFYIIAILFFLGPFRRERSSELMVAFFAFLAGMASFHILLGAGYYFNSLLLIHLGSFCALTGAAYTLKFPLTALRPNLRGPLFYSALIGGWLIIAWMLIFPHSTEVMLWLVFGYMILFSGGIAGLYIIWQGLKTKENWVRVKSIGGGVGIVTCCLAADLLVLIRGMSVLGELFMAIAPIILILSIYFGRYLKSRTPQAELSAR